MTHKRIIITLIAALCIGVIAWQLGATLTTKASIKVGILHSLTGSLAVYEKTAVDATLLAINEINQTGGLLGKKIQPIIADGKSDSVTFALEAEKLITQEKACVLFGCWASDDRKAVKPIVEKYNNLLFYPAQYEGLENSPNICYTSTTPNQQAIPATTWCLQNLGKKVFLVGTDELLARANNEIIKDTIVTFGGEKVAEEYIQQSDKDLSHIIQKIKATNPDVIINTIFGDANLEFFKQLRAAGITSEKIPTMSLTIDEHELQKYGAEYMVGDYGTWSHFQSIERAKNKEFVTKVKKSYGNDYVISDAMEAAYFGVYLWAQAVKKAQTTNASKVIPALKNQAFDAPEGIVYIDDKSLHSWSFATVGKIRSDKQFTVLWNSDKAIRPVVYPFFKSKEEWEQLLLTWYKQWGNKWSNI
jgi:urea transport system substrate-binding protein